MLCPLSYWRTKKEDRPAMPANHPRQGGRAGRLKAVDAGPHCCGRVGFGKWAGAHQTTPNIWSASFASQYPMNGEATSNIPQMTMTPNVTPAAAGTSTQQASVQRMRLMRSRSTRGLRGSPLLPVSFALFSLVESEQSLAKRKARIRCLACCKVADGRLRAPALFGNLWLRQAKALQLDDKCFPVHARIISVNLYLSQ